jgi:transcriptional regulator with XRE-family HTH domain
MSSTLHKETERYKMLSMTQTFAEWINRIFVEWQAKQGRRKTIEEFAIYLGVSRPLLTMWMNGNKKPGRDNIELLAEIFGNEVYDVLEKPRPNPYQQLINRNWEFLPEDRQKAIAEEAERYAAENQLSRTEKASQRRKAGKAQ